MLLLRPCEDWDSDFRRGMVLCKERGCCCCLLELSELWRFGMAPVKDGFRGMVDEELFPETETDCGFFGLRGIAIDGGGWC